MRMGGEISWEVTRSEDEHLARFLGRGQALQGSLWRSWLALYAYNLVGFFLH